MANDEIKSILAIDCGSTTTKAILLDVADGQYRFAARSQVPSTGNAPWHDITVGIYHAIQQTAKIAGRRMLDEDGQLVMPERSGRRGVDILAATVSASPPLRVVIAGLSQDVSLQSARRVTRFTYCQVVDQIALDEPEHRSDVQRLQSVQNAQPEVILLVGGVDGGATRPVMNLARFMALAVQLKTDPPPMIYAGNVALRSQIASLLGDQVELRAVDSETIMAHLPGLNLLKRWSMGDVLPTAQGLGHIVRYLDRLNSRPPHGVLGIDVGGMTSTVAAARGGRFSLTVLTGLGMGASIGKLLQRATIEQVTRWLPDDVSPDQVRHLVMNKELRPWTVAQTEQDLLIEQAIARQVISLALAEARGGWPFRERQGSPVLNEIIGCGSVLCHAPTPGHATLMLLDAVQPAFWTPRLALDKTGALPTLGALATVQPGVVAQMLERDSLVELGSVISPVGTARHGSKVLSFTVKSNMGAYEGDVRFGSLERIIVPAGVKATLELRPTRRFDLGVGRGKGVRMETWGGAVGIIIDARGRPLVWPEKKEVRQKAVRQWLQELGVWSSLTLTETADQLRDL
jgi:hypothetical protein